MHSSKEKVIEGYRISANKIGEGAFGAVFIGYDEKGNILAVKVINRDQVNGSASNFLHNQILALKSCKNEHIVGLIDIKKSSSFYYIFLQYCSEGDLARYIKKKGRIPEEDALEFFYQIIKGFRTIVKKSLIHRDLKPANIFLKNGQIKIGDFGLVKLLRPDTMAKTFAGSPYNMAPEVLKHQQYDSRADIYSIGTVLYQMLFGTPPFIGNNHMDLIEQIKIRRFHKFDSKLISKQTASLLARLLKQKADERMDWQELFNYQNKRKSKINDKLYDKYHDFLTKINLSKLCSIPSIFCLLNAESIDNTRNSQDTEFLDLNLSSTLFVNLIKSTNIVEDEETK